MTLAVAALSVLAFLAAFWRIGVVGAATGAMTTASGAMRVIASRELDDDTKERETQRAAIGLLGGVLSILWRSVAALVAAGIPIYVAEAAGLVGSETVIDFLARWDVIVIVSIVMIAAYLAVRRLWPAR